MNTELIRDFLNADPFGALHIVVDDGNLEDKHILSCLEDPEITQSEIRLAYDLLAISVEEREELFELAFSPLTDKDF